MEDQKRFSCFMVRQADGKDVRTQVEEIGVADLPAGDVLIRVEYSSVNYKDALACRAHPGVVRQLPHIPGIDCAGVVVESSVAELQPGENVLVTGYELGAGAWGGYSEYVRVPAEWVVRTPVGLTNRQAMVYGTAGFTAAQCVQALVRQGITPEKGKVVVTGATGGVGMISIALLSNAGYRVTAITGKKDQVPMLEKLGATEVLPREDVVDMSERPLLAERWASAVDTVGGATLATLLRSTAHRGCVAACGLVGGHELSLTVYPFILRGVTLAGIDSAKCPRAPRMEIWNLLSGEWNVSERMAPWSREITLKDLGETVEQMLAGENSGRIVVNPREK